MAAIGSAKAATSVPSAIALRNCQGVEGSVAEEAAKAGMMRTAQPEQACSEWRSKRRLQEQARKEWRTSSRHVTNGTAKAGMGACKPAAQQQHGRWQPTLRCRWIARHAFGQRVRLCACGSGTPELANVRPWYTGRFSHHEALSTAAC
eukprot:366375-Chlamydomonas_euryale.AAC.3